MDAYISIIIPAYNNAEDLKLVLDALEKQTYPTEQFETIVIDNGSTDETCEIAKGYNHVELLKEHEYLNSPYSARNRGIEVSNGDVITLLDATCVPKESWLENGIETLRRLNCDLVGGRIEFRFKNDKPTIAELYDSLTNVQIEKNIKERNLAKGGNLFVKKKVFEIVGLFPEGIRSGGDVSWTKKATNQGFILEYSDNAIVKYPAKGPQSLLKKQWRVSKGQPKIWVEEGREVSVGYLFLKLIWNIFSYPFRSNINQEISTSEYELNNWQRLQLLTLNYSIKIIMLVGNIYGYALRTRHND